MRLKRISVNNTPYLGVSSFCNDDLCLVPNNILKKEEKILQDMLDIKIIKTTINQSPLIGVYMIGVKNKVVIGGDSITSSELELLEKEGLKVKLVEDYNALGNLIAINSKYGFASPLLSETTVKRMSSFLKVDIERKTCAGLDLPGSSIYVNNNLFLVNPNVTDKEFEYLKKKFKVPGVGTTLNYGGSFVGNDAIGNNKALLVGEKTSNIEYMRVDSLVVEFDN